MPIVPGNQPPEEPTSWRGIGPPMYEPYVPPRPAPGPAAPQPTQDTVKKAAVGTVTVIAVLVGLFCVLPLLACFGLSAIGAIGGAATPDP